MPGTADSTFQRPIHMYMGAPVHSIAPTESLESARLALRSHRVSGLAVVEDDGSLLGVVTRSDLLRVGRSVCKKTVHRTSLELPEHTVGEAMTTGVLRLKGTSSVLDAARAMVEAKVHRVFVHDGGVVDGVLSTRDIMDAIADDRLERPLASIMTSPVETVQSFRPVSDALDLMEDNRISGLVVVEKDWPVGVFTQVEALVARDLPSDTGVDWAMSPAMLVLPHTTPVFRAAQQASSVDVRQVIVTRDHKVAGVVTGLDFCRLVAADG